MLFFYKDFCNFTIGELGIYIDNAPIGIDIAAIITTLVNEWIYKIDGVVWSENNIENLIEDWGELYSSSDLKRTIDYFHTMGVSPQITYTWGYLYEVILDKEVKAKVPIIGHSGVTTIFKFNMVGQLTEISLLQ